MPRWLCRRVNNCTLGKQVSSGYPFTCVSVLQIAEGSTVIDMTGPEPALVRQGKGDPSLFIEEVFA